MINRILVISLLVSVVVAQIAIFISIQNNSAELVKIRSQLMINEASLAAKLAFVEETAKRFPQK